MNGLELSFSYLADVFGGLTTFTMCLLPLFLWFFKGVRKLSQISLIQEKAFAKASTSFQSNHIT